MIVDTRMLEALPVAVYTTDSNGWITSYNQAAVELWGYRPELGKARWCGSLRLYWPDGRPMALDECPLARTLREKSPVREVEALLERPDGRRVPFVPYPTLLTDDAGQVTGAVNLLVDLTERQHSQIESARLAAIVASSDDAIVSKTLQGVITSWNAGAERIFGFTAEEMIGRPIYKIIPPELHHQEDAILATLGRGERVDHFDTVRLAKDGRRIDISLTVSPIRDGLGNIVGASKVARDITERKRAEQLQRLLFDELNHRVKNTLAVVQSIAGQSLRRAARPEDFLQSFRGRIQALARAHDLLVQGKMQGTDIMQLVRDQVMLGPGDGPKVTCSGPALTLDSRTALQLALVLHELSTNARKYGALSVTGGLLSITWELETDNGPVLAIHWRETGVPHVVAPSTSGFGSTLIREGLKPLGGQVTIAFGADGVNSDIRLPLAFEQREDTSFDITSPGQELSAEKSAAPAARILVVEDEVLLALEIAAELRDNGFEVVGPAGDVREALRLINASGCDAAILDANLGGQTVEDVASTLRQRDVPFAFATGYSKASLPAEYLDAPVLSKPFTAEALIRVIGQLTQPAQGPANVVPLRNVT